MNYWNRVAGQELPRGIPLPFECEWEDILPTIRAKLEVLAEIQDGTYAKNWIRENEVGRPWFDKTRQEEQDQQIERVGAELRKMMPFLDAVTIKA